MGNRPSYTAARLRPLGLIPVVALGLLTTLATGGGGGGGEAPAGGATPGTVQLLETSFDAAEGTIVNIRVNRSGGSDGVVSVDYTSADGTASEGSDYTAASGTLTWAHGVAGNQTISIRITDDGTAEASESFTVTLSNASVATLGVNTTATVNVIDDDANARLTDLSISAGTFDQIFQSTLTDYTAGVNFLAPTTTVSATTEDPNSTFTINGIDTPSGEESEKATLSTGVNTITVVVTAVDGTTTETYTVDVTRQSVASVVQRAYIKASSTNGGFRFGQSIALSGDTLAVGAPEEGSGATGINGDQDNDDLPESGAVYVFTRDPSGVWSQQAYVKASDTEEEDEFGTSVALSADTLAVGQVADDWRDPGAVYVFSRDGAGVWFQQAYLRGAFTPDAGENLGHSVALSGDTLVASARLDDLSGDEVPLTVYAFARDGAGLWSQQAALNYGGRVALSGDSLVASDPGIEPVFGELDGAYVLTRDETGAWSQQAYLEPSNLEASDGCCLSVALSGNTLVVGARLEDSAAMGINGDQNDNSAEDSGAVYVFTRDETGAWSQQAYIKASNTEAGDQFGISVTLSGDTLVVGAWREDSAATGINGDQSDNSVEDSGAVYVFTRDAAGVWAQQLYIKASNTDAGAAPGDNFGRSLALSRDRLAIGAPREDSAATGINGDQSDNSEPDAGAVYVFQ